ncbi:sensor histidine kinase [Paenibacillus humicola]|uniref:sensor histidine kinase n=1 Tax=Paenibacillus humicola TaxID=3110540 RepID=UPI00237B651B|nr:sensor histidine kinase [Paenibacillus humicola]
MHGRFRTVATQLFSIFFVSMIIPVLAGGYFSYHKSAGMIERQVSAVAQQTINQLRDKLNVITKKYEDTSMIFMYSQAIQKAIQPGPRDTEYEKEQQENEAVRLISSVMANSPELLHIYIFDAKKKNSVFDSNDELIVDHWKTSWYKSIVAAGGRPVWFGISDKSFIKATDMGIPVFGLGRALRNVQTGEVIGVIFIEIRGNVLSEQLDNVRFAKSGFAYLSDASNRVVYRPDVTYTAFEGKQADFPKTTQINHFTKGGKKYLMVPAVLNNGWMLNGIVPVQELVAESVQIRNLTILTAAVSVLWALAVGYYISRKIGRPLRELSILMKRSERGDLSVRSSIYGHNELGQLSRSFNNMIGQIGHLIRRISEEESEKQKAEIRALRYQINPHFLYNTLNSIRWMAKLGKPDKVERAISALVQLLEANVERKGLFVRLEEELYLLTQYMVIQQYRYEGLLQLRIDCPDDLMDRQIPRMLLQPIVENAIFHGIAPKDEPGTIDIAVAREGERLLIRISDDGVGIGPEELPELLKERTHDTASKGMSHIGLRHVHQSLQLYYGKEYGVRVASAPKKGTTVTLMFADSREEDAHAKRAAGR